ncbi:cytochrome c family protein [Kordiimonas sp. SCSIO 12603]|uniref:c-type cytochrome n=1 Tax=Kordiimonas sp. SCSIO 12603 TaxID=2829596 RepID=UPI0021029823|nr:cytochrome c family protein [Kordiimonas sp. SCSIO 12603]UTW59770.1 cytochrome c family protein [Kordiimonas sp. SCSIO 12603]
MRTFVKVAAVAALATVASVSSFAEGDAAKGEKVFRKCKACHTLEAGKNRVGPSLAGFIGRKAGGLDGYKYSKAMKAADFVWDDASFSEYMKSPRKFVKGTKMAFVGLKKPQDVADLLAYLRANGG